MWLDGLLWVTLYYFLSKQTKKKKRGKKRGRKKKKKKTGCCRNSDIYTTGDYNVECHFLIP